MKQKLLLLAALLGVSLSGAEITYKNKFFEVTFDTKGGKAVDAQMVEEDGFATTAETSKIGHDFTGWDYDFSTPITQNTKITAKYTIKYKLSNKNNCYFMNILQKNSFISAI